MQDFRESTAYKNFEQCRSNRNVFLNVLTKYGELNKTDFPQVKRSAIEALSYNETCSKLPNSFDLTSAPAELKASLSDALEAYGKRIKAENGLLTGVITGDSGQIKLNIKSSLTNTVAEHNKFTNLTDIYVGDTTLHVSGWVIVLCGIFVAAAFFGYLKRDKQESVGVIRFMFRTLRSVVVGVKEEVDSVKNIKKRNDDV